MVAADLLDDTQYLVFPFTVNKCLRFWIHSTNSAVFFMFLQICYSYYFLVRILKKN